MNVVTCIKKSNRWGWSTVNLLIVFWLAEILVGVLNLLRSANDLSFWMEQGKGRLGLTNLISCRRGELQRSWLGFNLYFL